MDKVTPKQFLKWALLSLKYIREREKKESDEQ